MTTLKQFRVSVTLKKGGDRYDETLKYFVECVHPVMMAEDDTIYMGTQVDNLGTSFGSSTRHWQMYGIAEERIDGVKGFISHALERLKKREDVMEHYAIVIDG